MHRRVLLSIGAVAVAAGAAIALPAGLAGGSNSTGDDPFNAVRDATSRFRKVERALDAGYVQFFGCVHEPLAGSMGIHFVNGELAGDGVIDASAPEALMYEVKANGKLELTGVEYVVFKEAWDGANAAPPQLFGQPFNTVAEPNRYGIPTFYELHAWVWKDNPTGVNEDWNPRVLCPGAEGHNH